MKLKNSVLKDLLGKPLKQNPMDTSLNGPAMTVASVLVNCCILPAAENLPRTEEGVLQRYDEAMRLTKIEPDAEFEIDDEILTALRADMLRHYPVLTAGQMLYALDPVPKN